MGKRRLPSTASQVCSAVSCLLLGTSRRRASFLGFTHESKYTQWQLYFDVLHVSSFVKFTADWIRAAGCCGAFGTECEGDSCDQELIVSMEEDTLRIAFLSDMSTRVMFLQRAAELGHSKPTSIANIVAPRGIDLRSISNTYWHNFRQIIFKTSTCFNETQPPLRETQKMLFCGYQKFLNMNIILIVVFYTPLPLARQKHDCVCVIWPCGCKLSHIWQVIFFFFIHSTVLGKCCKHMLYISYYAPVTMTFFS